MEEVFIIWTLIDQLSVLELIGYIEKHEPKVFMAPEMIIRPMMAPFREEVISVIQDIVDN